MKSINKVELHEIFNKLKEQRNESNFNKLYEGYGNLVYKIAFSLVKNNENSEDIKQKVFLKIWQMDKEKLPCESEASWLYSLTKNETFNYIRNQKDNVNIEEIYYISNEDKELNEIIDKDSYNRIISRLTKNEQEIVSLKILSNLSFRTIAQILNEPIGTIQWRYYKSLHTLKMLLSNLSMFIISMTIFISRITRRSDKNMAMEDIQNVQEGEEIKEDEENKEATLDRVENANSTNESVQENTTETIIIDNSTETKLDSLNIGILSISGIFLIFTIIFSIIFIKHQQKARKKVSK